MENFNHIEDQYFEDSTELNNRYRLNSNDYVLLISIALPIFFILLTTFGEPRPFTYTIAVFAGYWFYRAFKFFAKPTIKKFWYLIAAIACFFGMAFCAIYEIQLIFFNN